MTKVYRDFDQETLNREYNARGTVDDAEPMIRAYGELSDFSFVGKRRYLFFCYFLFNSWSASNIHLGVINLQVISSCFVGHQDKQCVEKTICYITVFVTASG